MKKAYLGYLELSRNLVSLVIIGWIKTRNKMLVCQVLAWWFSGFERQGVLYTNGQNRIYLVEKSWEHSRKMHSFINGCFFIHRYIHKHFLEAIDPFCFCYCPKCLLKRFDILLFFFLNWLIYPNLKSRPSIVKIHHKNMNCVLERVEVTFQNVLFENDLYNCNFYSKKVICMSFCKHIICHVVEIFMMYTLTLSLCISTIGH